MLSNPDLTDDLTGRTLGSHWLPCTLVQNSPQNRSPFCSPLHPAYQPGPGERPRVPACCPFLLCKDPWDAGAPPPTILGGHSPGSVSSGKRLSKRESSRANTLKSSVERKKEGRIVRGSPDPGLVNRKERPEEESGGEEQDGGYRRGLRT